MSSPNFQTLLLHFPSSISQSFSALFLALLLLSIFSFFLHPGGQAWAISKSKTAAAAIPGPSGLPFMGLLHIFTLSKTPHRALSALSTKFQAHPLMAFSVGLTKFVISSHPDFAKEILNSPSFADRPVKESAYELLFHRAMGFAPYGEYWRNLRRISSTYMFSPKRINAFEGFRREVGEKMISEIEKSIGLKGEVKVKEILHFGSLNNVMMTVFGKSYEFGEMGNNNGDGVELEELVREGYELLGILNWSDHFPILGWLDLQGVRRRCRVLAAKVNLFVGKIIEEHRTKREVEGHQQGDLEHEYDRDFVDVLLDLEKDDKLSDSDMIAVLWEMIFRGTDTVAILLEWILARMVLHPEIQAKAQYEIDSIVGKNPILDSDVPNLPFLQSIVKECLRMHPPGPLLSWARLAVDNVHIGGRLIPAGTTTMVNMWAITHNEKVWREAEKFEPYRFMEEGISVMGSDLRLAPFGAGRRVCPGKAMGLASVHLWLAQLLQAFKWVPSGNSINDGVDLSECLKLSLEMETPLVCKAIPRVG